MNPFDWSYLVKIAISIFCGSIIGFERQFNKKPIDVRAGMLVCVGTMTFVYLGQIVGGDKDTTRVLGQVVTGIGFLGAGAIITRQGLVIGLTSASVVWVLAAIGAAIGFNHYMIAVVLSIVTVSVLVISHFFEDLARSKNPTPPASQKT